MEKNFRESLQDLLFDANTEKAIAAETQGSPVARRWAVLHTELEKALAYYIAYLEPLTVKGE